MTDVSECQIDGCHDPVLARGWCRKHYKRWYVHGNPTYVRPPTPIDTNALERWWSKVDDSGNNCWEWTGRRSPKGYGQFDTGNRTVPAHRWGYQQLCGPVRNEEVVRHTCDNPGCCRPDHWLRGTQVNNIADMMERGRRAPTRGADNPNAKLTPDQVAEIRAAYKGPYIDPSQSALGRQYGVSQRMISLIIRGEAWSA